MALSCKELRSKIAAMWMPKSKGSGKEPQDKAEVKSQAAAPPKKK